MLKVDCKIQQLLENLIKTWLFHNIYTKKLSTYEQIHWKFSKNRKFTVLSSQSQFSIAQYTLNVP